VNVHTRRFFWVEQNQWIRLTVSAAGLRMINRLGLDAAIKKAAAAGNLTEIKTL
jgi:large subunit ribosomal protein L28